MRVLIACLLFGTVIEAKTMSQEDARAFLADEEKYVTEDGVPPCQTSQDIAFLIYVVENWQDALVLLERDAPSLREQCLILAAARHLPPKEYVRFLSGVCDLMEAGKLKIRGISFCFEDRGKEDFLPYNYDQPEVATLINRMEAIYTAQEPGEWETYFSSIKSGEGKKQIVKERTIYKDPMPETYKDESKEVYKLLVKEHKRLLAEERKAAERQAKTGRPSLGIEENETGSHTNPFLENTSGNVTPISRIRLWFYFALLLCALVIVFCCLMRITAKN